MSGAGRTVAQAGGPPPADRAVATTKSDGDAMHAPCWVAVFRLRLRMTR